MGWFTNLLGTVSTTFKIGTSTSATTLSSSATAARTLTLPDQTGTLATLTDVTSSSGKPNFTFFV